MPITIVGIVNCTPDSFSDGREDLSPTTLLDHARRLVDEGADMLDVGGDSTRPGSTCPGIEEEWRRIAPVLEIMAPVIPCSVDTHHVEVARRAINHGASSVNDISGTLSEEMINLVATTGVSYIFMYNAHNGAHEFGEGLEISQGFTRIASWIASSTLQLSTMGIAPEKLVADPGMGAFISKDPNVSWNILSRFHELPAPAGGLMLGCSRKGFLATARDQSPQSRDERSCRAGASAVTRVDSRIPTYLRVHNVALQRQLLQQWGSLSDSERIV